MSYWHQSAVPGVENHPAAGVSAWLSSVNVACEKRPGTLLGRLLCTMGQSSKDTFWIPRVSTSFNTSPFLTFNFKRLAGMGVVMSAFSLIFPEADARGSLWVSSQSDLQWIPGQWRLHSEALSQQQQKLIYKSTGILWSPFLLFLIKTRFHTVAQASLEFTVSPKLAFNVWHSSWLCFWNGGIAGVLPRA